MGPVYSLLVQKLARWTLVPPGPDMGPGRTSAPVGGSGMTFGNAQSMPLRGQQKSLHVRRKSLSHSIFWITTS